MKNNVKQHAMLFDKTIEYYYNIILFNDFLDFFSFFYDWKFSIAAILKTLSTSYQPQQSLRAESLGKG